MILRKWLVFAGNFTHILMPHVRIMLAREKEREREIGGWWFNSKKKKKFFVKKKHIEEENIRGTEHISCIRERERERDLVYFCVTELELCVCVIQLQARRTPSKLSEHKLQILKREREERDSSVTVCVSILFHFISYRTDGEFVNIIIIKNKTYVTLQMC